MKKFSETWNPLIFYLVKQLQLEIMILELIKEENNLLNDLKNHKFDIVYLLGTR